MAPECSQFCNDNLRSYGKGLSLRGWAICCADGHGRRFRGIALWRLGVFPCQAVTTLKTLDSPRDLKLPRRRPEINVFAPMLTAAKEGKSVAGYGAPSKSATLLHYCGIGKDLIEYTVDRSPYKQGRFLPGNHIPIFLPDRIRETKPDYVVILPRNLKGRNYRAVAVYSRVGRSLRCADSESSGLLTWRVCHESGSFLWRSRDAAQGLCR
jgi:hypothetical protein